MNFWYFRQTLFFLQKDMILRGRKHTALFQTYNWENEVFQRTPTHPKRVKKGVSTMDVHLCSCAIVNRKGEGMEKFVLHLGNHCISSTFLLHDSRF